MPELPEVETIKRGLEPRIVGDTLTSIDVLTPKTALFEQDDYLNAIGSKVTAVRRRAKVLIIDLASGYSLMFHLKMTGQVIVDNQVGFKAHQADELQGSDEERTNQYNSVLGESTGATDAERRGAASATRRQAPRSSQSMSFERFAGGHPSTSMDLKNSLPDSSTRLIFHFASGSIVYFNDQRKFGWVKLVRTQSVDEDPFLLKVGPEPHGKEFTLAHFKGVVKKRNAPIKAVLLDQTTVAGIGNIYADESLHLAKIHPAIKSSKLSDKQIETLYEAVKSTLHDGIERGGTSFTNYVNVLGTRGDYLEHARVFKREGLACRVCGSEILKTRVAGRGTHYCPRCQKP